MNKYPDFFSVLFGNGPLGFFFGYVVLALIAAIGIMLVNASMKYKGSDKSPEKWSWKYFLADNVLRIIAGLFLIPLFVRLVYEYVPPALMIFVCIGLGFGFKYLAKIAEKYGLLTTNKLSERIAEKIKAKEESS